MSVAPGRHPAQHIVRVEEISCQIKQRHWGMFLGCHSNTNEMSVVLGHETSIA